MVDLPAKHVRTQHTSVKLPLPSTKWPTRKQLARGVQRLQRVHHTAPHAAGPTSSERQLSKVHISLRSLDFVRLQTTRIRIPSSDKVAKCSELRLQYLECSLVHAAFTVQLGCAPLLTIPSACSILLMLCCDICIVLYSGLVRHCCSNLCAMQ